MSPQRDVNKDLAYFDSYLEGADRLLARSSRKLADGLIKPDRIDTVKFRNVWVRRMNMWNARYSRGEDLAPLVAELGDLGVPPLFETGVVVS